MPVPHAHTVSLTIKTHPLMPGFKYPHAGTQSLPESQRIDPERGAMMHYSRSVLSFMALYFSLEETSTAVLPSKIKREINWVDQDIFSRLSHLADMGDLSVGDVTEAGRDADSRAFLSESIITPPESAQRQNLHNHKPSEKRRKVAPVDSIGRFQMKGFRKKNAA